MSLPRFKAKRDASEKAIVKALEGMGCSVWRMDTPADLLVGFMGRNHICECKSPGTHYGKSLNDKQKQFNDSWRGEAIWILRDLDDVEAMISALRFAA
jgi:hypothetical protein